jgi:hypothetical protein
MKMFQAVITAAILAALLTPAVWSQDCCQGRVGDANGLGGDEPTIGDIGYMINAMFIYTAPYDWYCLTEADINQSGGTAPTEDDITIADISYLIDYLFVTGPTLGLPDCLVQSSEPYGYAISTGECKVMGDAAFMLACIQYNYDGTGSLSLTHQNAGLNCCPVPTLTVEIEGNTITVTESDDGLCDCYCLYDIQYQIENLPPGEYRIVFNEAIPTGGDPIDFVVDLVQEPVGSFCVGRENYPWTINLSGVVTYRSGCLSSAMSDDGTATTPVDQSCISYEYDGEEMLSVTHNNAGFNCCPDYFVVDVALDGNIITLTESEVLDQGGCACLCLFDFEFLVANLPPGVYHVVFDEPYANDDMEFDLDLTEATSGTICVERHDYPWGVW